MPISPANNLNVKTLRTSQLAAASSIGGSDLIQISKDVGGVYYSKKATFNDIVTFLGTVDGSYTGSFYLNNSGVTGSMSLPTSAGAWGTNLFMPVYINNTLYKIPLYPAS